MTRVVHVIPDLDVGGAEMMLSRLVRSMDRGRFENQVISLTGAGALRHSLEAIGVRVHSLGMRRARIDVGALPRLARLLRTLHPDLVQSWLYHADLLALLGTWFAGRPPLVWNVRCSDMDLRHYPALTRWVRAALIPCSRWVSAVVVNSQAGRRLHEALGYRVARWEVIPNGIDLDQFKPDALAREWLRDELQVPPDAVLIVSVARFDPMKDHGTLLAACGEVVRKHANAHVVLIGKDTPDLKPVATRHGLQGRIHLLGLRSDVHRLLAGADILCLSSISEGFPSVLMEGMACGLPCVTTDTGDAAAIVGETGVVVPRKNPQAMARALCELLVQGPKHREQLGRQARARIEKDYALPMIVKRYEALYAELAAHPL